MSRRQAQRGAVLLIMLAIVGLGSAWFLVSALNAETGGIEAQRKKHNAEVLQRAKVALIGYVAAQAIKAGESNPGAMPCPENLGDFDSTTGREGLVGTSCGTTTIGRFPWRTLGMEKLTDAAGEPLWYVVGPGWGVLSGSNTVINSNSVGQLTVDGVANAAVALIIAPGPAFSVQASAGCAAWNQARPATGAPDWRNYLECENASSPADASFVTTGASGSFNDQVMVVTAADVLPAIEAAIAKRIEREMVPLLSTIYADASSFGTSPSNPAYPFAAPFADPTTSAFMGQAGVTQGLLPVNYHSASCPADPRCASSTVTWGSPSLTINAGPGYFPSSTSCYTSGGMAYCEGYYRSGSMTLTMAYPANSITTGMRTVSNLASLSGFVQTWRWDGWSWNYLGAQSATLSRSLASNGALNFNTRVTLPSVPDWGYYFIYANRLNSADFGDHAFLDTSEGAGRAWFWRNEWYRFLYYAMAPSYAPGGTQACTSGSSCLTVTNLADADKQRAILVLVGRSLTALSQTRPSGSLQNYLDSAENRDLDSLFEQSPVNRTFNDRFISVAKNP